MKVRYKVSLIIGTVFLVLGLLSGLIISSKLDSGYGALELNAQKRDAQLLKQSLLSDLDTLSLTGGAWAHWDDMVAYIKDRSKDFEDKNFAFKALQELPISIAIILDTDRNVIWQGEIHRTAGRIGEASQDIIDLARNLLEDQQGKEERDLPAGFLLHENTLFAVSSLHVLSTQLEGPHFGYFVTLKRIDLPSVLDKIGLRQAYTSIGTVSDAVAKQSDGPVGRDASGRVQATVVIKGVEARKPVAITLSSQEQMAVEGERLRLLIYLSYLLMAGMLVLITISILERLILRRLDALCADLVAVRGDNLSEVVIRDRGDDELGLVGKKAAEMLRSLKESYQEVQRVGQEFRETTDRTPVLIWKLSTDGYITYNNSTLQAFTGRDFTGQHLRALFSLVKDEDKQRAKDSITTIQADYRLNVELRMRSFSGNYVWVVISLAQVRDETGTVTGYVASATNVQHQKDAQEQLAKAHALAVELSQAKSNFIATVSHELRTPMNGIMGTVTNLMSTPLSEEQKDEMVTIQSCADHLLVIINDLLDYSQICSGSLQLVPTPSSIRSIFDRIESLFRRELAAKDVHILFHIHHSVPEAIEVDAVRLRQMLTNLVGNAVKFVEQGGGIIVIAECSRSENNELLLAISVSDSGIGMTEVQQIRVFEPFTQADATITRRFGGTGLGLTITRKLVELHGGEISLKSKPGIGSTFTFVIPTREVAVEVVGHGNTDIPSLPALTILLVEDNPINQRVAQKLLNKMGHSVTVASDGEEAIERLLCESFDLILMDCHMPRLDGISATRAIGRLELDEDSPLSERGRTPIVALTARAMEEDRAECFESGMDGFIAKPIHLNEIRRALYEAMKGKAPLQIGDIAASLPRS